MVQVKENPSINSESKIIQRNNLSLIIHQGGKDYKRAKKKVIFYKEKFEDETQMPSTFDLSLDIIDKNKSLGNKGNEPSTGGGGDGGNGMEKRLDRLEQRTEQIQSQISGATLKLAVIEEIQKSILTKSDFLEYKNEIMNAINNLPKEDNIKQIVSSTITEKKLATESFVNMEVIKHNNTQIKWLIGTAITTCGAVVGILKLLG